MNAFAAVMTGKGVAAIATVCVFGEDADQIVKNIFQPIGKADAQLTDGKILLGNIVDDEKIIDQVVIGSDGENEFAINCHGNPLIVEMIMELLARHGVQPVSGERLLQRHFKANNTIALEANLLQLRAKTIEGYKLLQNQIEGGLSDKAIGWLSNDSLKKIQREAANILKASLAGDYIIRGCKVVIAGPANSGKSTLLNCLAGREKSIVADIPGTTRDWVSAACTNGPLSMEIFDTAGLNESLTIENAIDKAAQDRSIELLKKADVVIWVIDGTDENADINFLTSNLKNQIIAINKSDLGIKIKTSSEEAVNISAKNGTGIDQLMKKIRIILGVEGFDLKQAVCFTDRQQKLLEKLSDAKNFAAARSIITELLNGPVRV